MLSRFRVLTDVNTKTGLTPIMQATKNNDYKTLSLLVREIEYIKKSYYELSDKPLLKYLDITDSNYNTALSYAIKNRSYKCADLLLKTGTTLDSDNERTKCDSYLIQAIKAKDCSILDLVIRSFKRNNSDLDLKRYLSLNANSCCHSPIGLAIESGDLDCARLLEERYEVTIPEQHKNSYNQLKLDKQKNMVQGNVTHNNIIIRIFKNILNSIISVLFRIGFVQYKNVKNN